MTQTLFDLRKKLSSPVVFDQEPAPLGMYNNCFPAQTKISPPSAQQLKVLTTETFFVLGPIQFSPIFIIPSKALMSCRPFHTISSLLCTEGRVHSIIDKTLIACFCSF
jgi:hypothetical protein